MTVSPSLKKKLLVAFAAAVVAALAWWSWTRFTDSGPGEGFVNGNGRIEATEIDVATKLPGRIEDILVREGDFVTAGQPLAKMRLETLEAQRDEALAMRQQAEHSVTAAQAQVALREADVTAALALVGQRESELDAAQRRLTRSSTLSSEGAASIQELDDDRARVRGAQATLAASKAQAAAGVKTTEIFAGQYKRIASNYAPLSKEGRQTMQDQVDYTYSLFVGAVAKHRGVSTDVVLQDMADGRIFIGQQAIDAGLVDGVSTLELLVAQLNASRASGQSVGASRNRAGVAQPKPIGAAMPITREQLAAEAPDVLAAIQAEGASAERERIQSIEAQAIPGHEALIASLKFDGKSTAGDAAMAVLAAEKQARTTQAAKLAGDAPAPLPLVPAATVEPKADTRADLDAKAKAYQAAHPGTDYVAAVKAVQTL